MGRNALKLSTNVHRQLGSHPSLYRIFARRSRLGKMCGTTLKAASMHNPPVTYNQSTSVPQQILYTALVFQALKFSFNSDIYSPLSWLDTALESHRGRQNDLVNKNLLRKLSSWKNSTAICLPTQILLHDFPSRPNLHSKLLPRRQTDLHKVSGTYPCGAGEGTAFKCQWFLWPHEAADGEILPLSSRTLSYLHSAYHKITIVLNQKIIAVGIVTILSFCKIRVKCVHPSKHINFL